MTQISRPFQIALLAVAVLMAVWFVALRGHSTSSTSAASGGSPAAASSAPSSSPGSASSIYHGSAPGVEGLSRAIAKAHGAVATSQQNARELAQKSAQASAVGGTAATSASSGTPSAARTTTSAGHAGSTPAATHKAAVTPAPRVAQHPSASKAAGSLKGVQRTPARQVLVERALKEGKIAVILFWNKRGADDVAVNLELQLLEAVHHIIKPRANTPKVRRELRAYNLELNKPFAAFVARADQVASFGTITHGAHVYGTPTILIVNKKGQVRTITGLTDAYSIEQTIDEARHG
ncbi:MAG TPA: hypothetical protein VHY83_06665 [Solirubrobacteraceae bacterium]|jgi:hypothetical protein|nr:hypothetical protein [Solirubrobacteraceae bacterium]